MMTYFILFILLATVTTARFCEDTEGMEDPQIIADEDIDVPNGNPGDLRPGDDTPWQSLPDDENPEVTLTLADEGEPPVQLGDFGLPSETVDNVDSFVIYLVDEDGVETPYNPENPESTTPQVSTIWKYV